MFYKSAIAAILVVAATPSLAEVTGGSLAVAGQSFSEGDDTSAVNYSGSLEYGFNRNWSIAGDIASYDHSFVSGTGVNLTIHLMYHLNEDTTVGLFRAADAFEDEDGGDSIGEGITGIEAGYETGQFEGEAFLGRYDKEGIDSIVSLSGGTLFGASGAYEFNTNISAIANLGVLNSDVSEVTRFSGGAEYTFDSGPSIYAEVGKVSTDADDSNFIGLGARVAFGADRGTTFGIRSAFDTVKAGF